MTRRRQPSRTLLRRKNILVLSEDTEGARDYLDKLLKSKRDDAINVTVKGCGVHPNNMLTEARRALRSNSDKYGENAFVFLIFDRDNRPNFNDCVRKIDAEQNMAAITSSQCFEYFWQLHYQFSCRDFSPTDMVANLKQFDGFENYNKKPGSVPVLVLSRHQATALENCNRARQNCRENGSAGPYTDMDLLIEYITEAKLRGMRALEAIDQDNRFYHPDRI